MYQSAGRINSLEFEIEMRLPNYLVLALFYPVASITSGISDLQYVKDWAWPLPELLREARIRYNSVALYCITGTVPSFTSPGRTY